MPSLLTAALLLLAFVSPPALGAKPLSLKEALERAMVTNRNLAIQQRKVDYQEATDIKPLLGMLPKVDLTLSRGITDFHDDDRSRYGTDLSLEIKENIDLLGGSYRAYNRNLLGVDAERQHLTFAKSKLVLDVTSAYLDVSLLKRKVEIQKKDLARFKVLNDATDAKLKVGRVARIDLLNVKFAASKAENSFLQTQRQLNTARRKLDRLVFAAANPDVSYQDSRTGPYFLSGFRDEYLNPGDTTPWLNRRGDIRGDELSWQQSRSELQEIDYKFLPSLDLVGKFTKNLGPAWLDQPLAEKQQEVTSSVALVLSWNIFNGGVDFMTRKENYEKVAVGQLQLQEKRDTAAERIANLREEIAILENLVQSKDQEVILATERYKLSESKYQLGGLSTEDYLLRQKESLAAEVGLVEATFELYRNKCELLHQLGVLLDTV